MSLATDSPELNDLCNQSRVLCAAPIHPDDYFTINLPLHVLKKIPREHNPSSNYVVSHKNYLVNVRKSSCPINVSKVLVQKIYLTAPHLAIFLSDILSSLFWAKDSQDKGYFTKTVSLSIFQIWCHLNSCLLLTTEYSELKSELNFPIRLHIKMCVVQLSKGNLTRWAMNFTSTLCMYIRCENMQFLCFSCDLFVPLCYCYLN